MNILKYFKRISLARLQRRSAKHVNFIRDTINRLRATNEAIEAEHACNDAHIAKLNAENASLDALRADNTKIITNFEGLLT